MAWKCFVMAVNHSWFCIMFVKSDKRHDHFSRNQLSVINFPPVLMCVISVEERKVIRKPPRPPLSTAQGSDARRMGGA